MKLQRYLKCEINKDAIKRTPEGFLIAPVIATRTGVLPYIKSDGRVIREARLPQEVFSQESMDSMKDIPVTNDHPSGLVNSDNATSVTKGWTFGEVKQRDGKFIETAVKIIDAQTIQDVLDDKKVEVSMGYEVEKDEQSGRFDNEDYDVVQRNIRYNHLAIVTRGRAGPEVKLRLDSADNQTLGGEMKKVKIGDKSFDVADDSLADAIDLMQKKMDKMEKDLGAMCKKDEADALVVKAKEEGVETKKALDTLQAKFDESQAEVEKLKKGESKMDAAEVQKIAREMTRASKVAETVLDEKEFKAVADKDVSEIKKAVIKKDSPSIDEKKLESAAYVDARFDAIAERALSSNRNHLRVVGAAIVSQETNADAEVNAEKSRVKQVQDGIDAWKQPLAMKV